MKNKLIFLFLLLGLVQCQKINYYPDKLILVTPPQIIAHRGGRTNQVRENTFSGIKQALHFADGVEVDVQISKDRTIWLSHSVDLTDCSGKIGCFPESTDSEIEAISNCNGKDISYSKLEPVFKLIADSFPSKKVCIDLKGWFPCSANSLEIDGMMRLEAKLIIKMASSYGIEQNVLFEIETTTVLDYINSKRTNVGTYLNSYGDFERAMLICLKQNYSGISYKTGIGEKLSQEKMDLLHRKGLKLIAWNVNDSSIIPSYISMGVDFVQKDF